jgi:hypothetical protein
MPVTLEAVIFNHDPADASTSAINVRRNALFASRIPEWIRSDPQSDAAYAINPTRGKTITIRAQLRRSGSSPPRVEVRAVDPNVTANVLGEVAPRPVTFSAGGLSAFETFALRDVRLAAFGVGVFPVTWRWQQRLDPHQPWLDFAETSHRIFALVSVPQSPWEQEPFVPSNTQIPWTDVLEYACRWATTARTLDDAAARVTQAVFDLGGEVVEYGCPILGATQYSFPFFNCTEFLERLRGGFGRGRYVNCTDCATIVSTFANALGCRLWQSIMAGPAPFALNPIVTIGDNAWRTACNWGAFTYHEVAWKGACTSADSVFDACLLIDGDPNPAAASHQPLLVANMPFGAPGGYRDRLAAPTPSGRPFCIPQPSGRRRRPVV